MTIFWSKGRPPLTIDIGRKIKVDIYRDVLTDTIHVDVSEKGKLVNEYWHSINKDN